MEKGRRWRYRKKEAERENEKGREAERERPAQRVSAELNAEEEEKLERVEKRWREFSCRSEGTQIKTWRQGLQIN